MTESFLSIAKITTLISLLFTVLVQYVPGINVKWGGLAKNTKKYIVLAGYLAVGAVVAWGGCIAFLKDFIPALLCVEPATFLDYAAAVVVAVGLGQGVFGIAPEAGAVIEAKAERE